MRVIFQFFMHISDIRICMSFYWNIMYLTLYPFWKKYFSILLQCQHLRGKVLATMSLKCIVYPSAKSGVTCNKDKYCLWWMLKFQPSFRHTRPALLATTRSNKTINPWLYPEEMPYTWICQIKAQNQLWTSSLRATKNVINATG